MQQSEPAAPSILIHTITLHFIGNPKEEDKAPKFSLNSSSSSLTNIYKQFSIPNPFQQITTKELQH